MKKLILLSIIIISIFSNAQLANNKRLVVPEFGGNTGNNKVKTYFPTTPTTITADEAYTINFSTLGNGLATSASPNVVTMRNNDLFVTLTLGNQRIYRFPGYGNNPASAIANVSQITADGTDYVGIAFDTAGNLYCSEGSFLNTRIIKYNQADGYATKLDLGNGGITSYFANIVFDSEGSLWATDYLNNRLIYIDNSDLSIPTPQFSQLTNDTVNWTVVNSFGNTDPTLNAKVIKKLFSQPEGLAFDAQGSLWIANNNDSGDNLAGTIVQIKPGFLDTIITNPTTAANFNDLGLSNGIRAYNMPDSPNGRSQFGGLQIDTALNRIYVTEQKGCSGLWLNILNVAAVTNNYNTHKMNIVTTNLGNGGIFLADATTNFLSSDNFDFAAANVNLFPNPSNGNFKISLETIVKSVVATDVLGKQINIEKNGDDYAVANAQSGIYFVKITLDNDSQIVKKMVIE